MRPVGRVEAFVLRAKQVGSVVLVVLVSSAGATATVSAASPENVAVRYPADRTQSPITESVGESLRVILASGSSQDPHVFMKVGDSISSGPPFVTCFAEPPQGGVPESVYRDYGGLPLGPTVEYFSTTLVPKSHGSGALSTPFERQSLTAVVARDSLWLPGDPSRVDDEVADLHPQYAVVMFGTNDLGYGGSDAPSTDVYKFTLYPQGMMDTVDLLIERGVVPMLLSIPPRGGQRYPLLVASYNAVVRGIAEARQVPFADYNREMGFIDHPAGGMADDLHPNAYTLPQYWPQIGCNLTSPALEFGYNVLNKVIVGALDRMRQLFEGDLPSLDPAEPEQALQPPGQGSAATPYLIQALPFTDIRDIRESSFTSLTAYSGCGGGTSSPGPEYVYRLVVSQAARLRVFVAKHGGSNLSFRLSALESPQGSGCLVTRTTNPFFDGTFQPGAYYFSVDVSSLSPAGSGEFMLGVLPCDPEDTTACNTHYSSSEPPVAQIQIQDAVGSENATGSATVTFAVTVAAPGS